MRAKAGRSTARQTISIRVSGPATASGYDPTITGSYGASVSSSPLACSRGYQSSITRGC